jgi:hypothetical protein
MLMSIQDLIQAMSQRAACIVYSSDGAYSLARRTFDCLCLPLPDSNQQPLLHSEPPVLDFPTTSLLRAHELELSRHRQLQLTESNTTCVTRSEEIKNIPQTALKA